MRLQRIPHRIWHYTRKLAYASKTSSPFISPDTFMRIADLSLDKNFYPGIQKIKEASVIFVNSGDADKFFCEYGSVINAKVLIFGNNDVDFKCFDFPISKSVKKIFLQNSTITDSFFQTIPIGIESLKYVTNGVPQLFSSKYVEVVKNDRILVGPFSNTHIERAVLQAKAVKSFSKVDFVYERLKPIEYASLSSSYAVIACPRGNGLDTHRFWEALYRGSVPLVKESPWSNYWSRKGVPMIEIADWECDLDRILSGASRNLEFNPDDLEILWEPFWYSEIRRKV